MLKKLMPRRDFFFEFFEKHAAISLEAAQALVRLIDSETRAVDMFQKIKDLEHNADEITHQCVEALHKTFITPMDRMDIYRLITTLDDITDEIESTSKRIFLYKLGKLPPDVKQFAEILQASVAEIIFSIKDLRNMKITEISKQHFIRVNQLENEADTLLSLVMGRLFEEEQDAKTLIKYKEIYEHLERATDVCEDVSNIIEGIILENE